MEKIMICFMAVLVSFVTQGQHIDPQPVLTKEDYLQKSKKQKTAAIVLHGVGSGMAIVGVFIALDDLEHIGDPGYEDNSDLAGALFYGGIVIATGSIPFYISSRKNRKKAVEMSINPKAMIIIKNGTFIDRTVPSLSIRMPL